MLQCGRERDFHPFCVSVFGSASPRPDRPGKTSKEYIAVETDSMLHWTYRGIPAADTESACQCMIL
ncbi:hypothetical protein PsYK624_024990 [Phanerochaete sordida]|uniref:Uncharacterized protein n=1 Tax=Phanerochaete sordida TaxID=48140 RepID=A0A9P3G2E7_9APHY|nr:hypothetical protein PsYK624_024990 [Phanerochaete sordida]